MHTISPAIEEGLLTNSQWRAFQGLQGLDIGMFFIKRLGLRRLLLEVCSGLATADCAGLKVGMRQAARSAMIHFMRA
jgi:hypothetical protein